MEVREARKPGRGLHSFTVELHLSTCGTHSWVKLGYVDTMTAQVELKVDECKPLEPGGVEVGGGARVPVGHERHV